METNEAAREETRRKLEDLHHIIQVYRRHHPHLDAQTKKCLCSVAEAASMGLFPRKSRSPVGVRLGQYVFLTFKLPDPPDDSTDLPPELASFLGSRVKAILLSTATRGHVGGFRFWPEHQTRDQSRFALHWHAQLSLHQFRESDRQLAKQFPAQEYWQEHDPQTLRLQFFEPLFRVPLVSTTAEAKRGLLDQWTAALLDTGLCGPDYQPADLLHISAARGVRQTEHDRVRTDRYRTQRLKNLENCSWWYRQRKGGVRFRYPNGKRFTLSVSDFVEQHVLLPLMLPTRAITCGALYGNSPFSRPLQYFSGDALNHPPEVFEFWAHGTPWAQALDLGYQLAASYRGG